MARIFKRRHGLDTFALSHLASSRSVLTDTTVGVPIGPLEGFGSFVMGLDIASEPSRVKRSTRASRAQHSVEGRSTFIDSGCRRKGSGCKFIQLVSPLYIWRAFAAASARGVSIPFFSTSGSRSRRSAFSVSPPAIRKTPRSFPSPASPAHLARIAPE